MYKAGYEIKGVIKEYKKTLKNLGINVKRVILYGSFANGSQKGGSDIDLVVISDDFEKMDLRRRLEVLGVAAVRIMKPIEARGYTSRELKAAAQPSFLNEILRFGVAI